MSSILDDIFESTRLARENALLGKYKSSSIYYTDALSKISAHISKLDSVSTREKWMTVKYELNKEHETVKGIMETLKGFVSEEPKLDRQVNNPAIAPVVPRNDKKILRGAGPSKPVTTAQKKAPGNSAAPNKNQAPNKNASAQKEKGEYVPSMPVDKALIDQISANIMIKKTNVSWDDIAELDEAKKLLREAVVLPLRFPNLFSGIRKPWKGVLMYGPPGTGKTLLAKAVGTEANTTFFNVPISNLSSKWRGESEKLVHVLFDMARFYAPSTIFIDEIDAIGGKRDDGDGGNESNVRVMSELLTCMDGVGAENNDPTKTIMLLGATNRPWKIDEALRRRLEKRIYIPLPNKIARKTLLQLNLKDVLVAEDVDIDEMSDKLEGYSGADITQVCRDASMMHIRRYLDKYPIEELSQSMIEDAPITKEDFNWSISKINKSVSQSDLDKYVKWSEEFGSL